MKKYTGFILLTAIIILLILLKWTHLSLPYFWDEAWPYSTAVHMMYENGLSLFPGAIPFEISRGHPLFFHFMSALGMKVFGSSITGSHIFPLVVSIALIVLMYVFCRKFFSEKVAIISCILLAVQPVFIAQACLLLPEMLVAFLSLFTLYFFLTNKTAGYIICGTLLLLTKETGIVTILSCGLLQVIELLNMNRKEVTVKMVCRKMVVVIAPVIIPSLFFVVQKIKFGFFFLPLYTDADNFNSLVILEKLKNYSAYLFIYQGRNAISALLIISAVIFFFVRKKSWDSIHKKVVSLLSIFIVLYLAFSSANFYSPRYLLSILVPFIVVSVFFFDAVFSERKVLYYSFFIVVAVVQVTFCLKRNHVSDHSLSYTDAIEVSKNMTDFCAKENLYSKNIYCSFLMHTYLTDKYAGYITDGKLFDKVQYSASEQTQYYIQLSYEKDELIEQLKAQKKIVRLLRFEKNYAWSEIYAVEKSN